MPGGSPIKGVRVLLGQTKYERDIRVSKKQIMDSHSSRGGTYKISARKVCLFSNSHNISSLKPGVISLLGTVECNQMQENAALPKSRVKNNFYGRHLGLCIQNLTTRSISTVTALERFILSQASSAHHLCQVINYKSNL